MKHKLKIALASALAATSFNAFAEEAKSDYSISYNVGLFSQYIFRGYTQTHNDPALQGGVDFEHSSGFYAGAWASNVSWLDDSNAYDNGGSLEIDLYAGYAADIGETGLRYDVGVLQYLYPGEVSTGIANANTTEVHAGLGYGWVDTTIHVVTSNDAWTWGDAAGASSAKGTTYYDLNVDVPVGDLVKHKYLEGVSGIFHLGYQHFAGATNNQDSYADWKVGATKSFDSGIDAGYYYTGTDVRNGNGWWVARDGKFLGDSAHTFFVSKSF
jgi:uncharacterized protein (TIGR02001 family)